MARALAGAWNDLDWLEMVAMNCEAGGAGRFRAQAIRAPVYPTPTASRLSFGGTG